MNKYPTEITDAILEQNKHIPDDEIRKDIADTLAEIAQAEQAITGYEAEAQLKGMPHAKMALFRADGHRLTNQDRRLFVNFLNKLLDARKEKDGKATEGR
ncbi:hypothetical protein ANRL3_01291 [Anaerolineae bacterium]|nr:hypothetical protein ANRL3_01291 [Anaerolineae bacterium]